ncbi:MAG: hypothetical protein SOZ59_15795 [Candidatus Limivivens sp.]|nr:hypothetical protein [Candidatus Limivivens sp.]
MKEKFQRFMAGRYGVDELSRFLLWVTAILCVVSLFVHSGILSGLVFLAILILYFRMFSKNYAKRSQENQVYLKYQNRFTGFFRKQKNLFEQRKIYHIYSCPNCRQKIRIPKGKGKICVTCPKCRTEFIKKS